MEEERVTNKQGKKRTNPLISSLISVGGGKGGGGGIAGLVLFGGALAVVGYVAVASFARNKNHNKAAKGKLGNRTKSSQELLLLDECGCKGEEDHALHSLLQHSKPQHLDAACGKISDMNKSKSTSQVSPSDLLSAQTLILLQEEKTQHNPNSEEENPTSFHHQEIAFSDHSHPESAASSNENGVAEDCLASLFNSPNNGKTQEMEIYEPQGGLKSIETESEDDSNIIDDEEEDDDGILGSGEEDSSKETGCTSLDYNEEPVWPSELIQEPQPELFKGGYFDNNHDCSDCDADGSDYAENERAMKISNDATLNKKANSSVVVMQDPPSAVLRTLAIPALLLVLLLFLVLLTRQESMYVLDEGSTVIAP